jgi:Fe2+ or Zn2+ uptake regulation protein
MSRLPASRASTPASDVAQLVSQTRLRVTPQRVVLLRLLLREGGHLTADELHRRAEPELPGLSPTSIYKSLRALRDAGLVREVTVGNGAVRYDANVGQQHHHRVCRRCGRVDDVACPSDLGGACVAGHDLGAFRAEQVDVIYRGLCSVCQPTPDATESVPMCEREGM